MGIIAWIVLGLGAGLLANMLIPGRRSQGLVITCVIGIAGALLGGWLATKLFHVVTLHGFFNLSTWLTAIAGAAVLLLAYHLVTSRSAGAAAAAAAGHAGGRTGEHPDAAPPAANGIATCLTAVGDTTDSLPELTIQPRKGDASCPSQPVLPLSSSGRSSRSP